MTPWLLFLISFGLIALAALSARHNPPKRPDLLEAIARTEPERRDDDTPVLPARPCRTELSAEELGRADGRQDGLAGRPHQVCTGHDTPEDEAYWAGYSDEWIKAYDNRERRA